MTDTPQPDTVVVQDLNQFVLVLIEWHAKQIATLKHYLELPVDTEVKFGEEEPIKLTSDRLAGMKFGLELALMHFDTLPFSVELEDAPPTSSVSSNESKEPTSP